MSQPDTDKAAAAQGRSRETEPLVISTNAGTIEPPEPRPTESPMGPATPWRYTLYCRTAFGRCEEMRK